MGERITPGLHADLDLWARVIKSNAEQIPKLQPGPEKRRQAIIDRARRQQEALAAAELIHEPEPEPDPPPEPPPPTDPPDPDDPIDPDPPDPDPEPDYLVGPGGDFATLAQAVQAVPDGAVVRLVGTHGNENIPAITKDVLVLNEGSIRPDTRMRGLRIKGGIVNALWARRDSVTELSDLEITGWWSLHAVAGFTARRVRQTVNYHDFDGSQWRAEQGVQCRNVLLEDFEQHGVRHERTALPNPHVDCIQIMGVHGAVLRRVTLVPHPQSTWSVPHPVFINPCCGGEGPAIRDVLFEDCYIEARQGTNGDPAWFSIHHGEPSKMMGPFENVRVRGLRANRFVRGMQEWEVALIDVQGFELI